MVVLPTLGTSSWAPSCSCTVQDRWLVIKNNTATGVVFQITMDLLSSSQIIKSEYWQVTFLRLLPSCSVLPRSPTVLRQHRAPPLVRRRFTWFHRERQGRKNLRRCVWCVGLISDLKNLDKTPLIRGSMLSVSFKSSAKDGISELMLYSYDLRGNLWKGEFSSQNWSNLIKFV